MGQGTRFGTRSEEAGDAGLADALDAFRWSLLRCLSFISMKRKSLRKEIQPGHMTRGPDPDTGLPYPSVLAEAGPGRRGQDGQVGARAQAGCSGKCDRRGWAPAPWEGSSLTGAATRTPRPARRTLSGTPRGPGLRGLAQLGEPQGPPPAATEEAQPHVAICENGLWERTHCSLDSLLGFWPLGKGTK